jgi:hypothetical protein
MITCKKFFNRFQESIGDVLIYTYRKWQISDDQLELFGLLFYSFILIWKAMKRNDFIINNDFIFNFYLQWFENDNFVFQAQLTRFFFCFLFFQKNKAVNKLLSM